MKNFLKICIFLSFWASLAFGQCQTQVQAKLQTQMNVCISQNGNVLLEGPPTWPQILTEGYAICGDQDYVELGSDTGQWNPSQITQPKGPNTFPLTILRQTRDGRYWLTQVFTLIGAGKILEVSMQVSGQNSGTLIRYVVPTSQTLSHTQNSVFAWDSYGLLLQPKKPSTSIMAKVVPETNDPCQQGSQGQALMLIFPLTGKAVFDYSTLR